MTVDRVQQRLMKEVFDDRKDIKKTAGRALGVVQEVIIGYLLRHNGLSNRILLETDLPEYRPGSSEPGLTHRVEFTLHQLISTKMAAVKETKRNGRSGSYLVSKQEAEEGLDGSLKLVSNLGLGGIYLFSIPFKQKSSIDFSSAGVFHVAECVSDKQCEIRTLSAAPVAYIECKRVGLEEGTATGPQTIEKAKQAAYVALRSSAVQKIRTPKGLYGAFYHNMDKNFKFQPYESVWEEIIRGRLVVPGAVRSVVFLGNMVNWFPGGVAKKDIKVLVENYDWVIWVEDAALVQFAEDLLFRKTKVAEAFKRQHSSNRKLGERLFSKQSMWIPAHEELCSYIASNYQTIKKKWFRVLGREKMATDDLFLELDKLATRGAR
jgi:hypothetical protein